MTCPFCSTKTKIYNSRSTHSKTQTWRRHRCSTCNGKFTTREKIDWSGSIAVITSDGTAEYSRERLLLSLAKASNGLPLPPEMLSELCDSIEHQLQSSGFFATTEQPASLIIEAATTVLHRYSPNFALQYVNVVYSNQPPLELVKRLVTA